MSNNCTTKALKAIKVKGTKYDRSRKMTPEMVEEAKEMVQRHLSYDYIARVFKVHVNTVRRWVEPSYREEVNAARRGRVRLFGPDKEKTRESIEIRKETKRQILLGNLDYQPPTKLETAKNLAKQAIDEVDHSMIFEGNPIKIYGKTEEQIAKILGMIFKMGFSYKEHNEYILVV